MMVDPADIEVLVNNTGSWPLPEGLLEDAVGAALDSEGIRGAEVSLTLLDDDGIRQLNLAYFQKDRPTDVIAFPLHEPEDPILGDVYLGFEQARRQATELDIPLEEELLRLAIHGTLHLLGFRHPEGDDRFASEMFLKQEELVRKRLAQGPLG
jgi:probable rRNA maturation factor